MNNLEDEIKNLIIEALELEDVTIEDIGTDDMLFGDGLGLDSIDALELGLALKNKYDVQLEADTEVSREHFYSVASLANFVRTQGKAIDENKN